MQELFTNPDGYFDSLEDTSLKTPALIVSLVILIGLVTNGLYAYRMTVKLSADVQPVMLLVSMISGGITSLLLPLLGWFFFAGCFHTAARRYTETNTFRRTFTLVGYGFIPLIISQLLYSVSFVTVLQSTDPPTSIETIGRFDQAVSTHFAVMAAELLTSVFLLWCAILWVYGIKHAHELELRDAIKVVSYTILPVFLFQIYALL